jgi:hypothetical protein
MGEEVRCVCVRERECVSPQGQTGDKTVHVIRFAKLDSYTSQL